MQRIIDQKSDLVDFAARLKATREAKSLNQKDFAELGGVGKTSQVQYEAGNSAPSIDYLYRLADHGVDIGYLLTGRRSGEAGRTLSVEHAERFLADAEVSLGAERKEEVNLAKLKAIAQSDYLPDRTKAYADMLLRLGFDDADATARYRAKLARREMEIARINLRVRDGAARFPWKPSERIIGAIARMLDPVVKDADDTLLAWLIEDLLAAIDQQFAGAQRQSEG